ncbi:MAG TPA: glutathione S-transferase family protein [Alphaproteobacteria bacterium]|nr:glutathione S-transferase family protein [Alphaproteobacteria bacterium]
MITLYGFGPGWGLPEKSPYVTKTEVQLKMAGLAYVKELGGPDKAPKGKLPFIDDDGTVVADSTFIRAHLERSRGIDFDFGLNEAERAQAWAIERMIEDHLNWANAHSRWLIPANFDKGPAHIFDTVPEPARAGVREAARSRVTAAIYGQGFGRHSEAEIWDLASRSLAALSALLGDKPYLFGDRPCGADATAFSAIAAILTPFFSSELRRLAEGHGNLVDYHDRGMARFYPEFAVLAA